METAPNELLSSEWTEAPSALQQRMQSLQDRVEDCRQRLQSQDQTVVDIYRTSLDLQDRAKAMQKSIEDMTRRLQALGVGVQEAAPAVKETVQPEPAVLALPQAAAPQPEPAAPEPQPDPRPPAGGGTLLRALPYFFIAAAGLGYGLKSQAFPAPEPAAAAVAAPQPPAYEEPAASEPENEALRLVYEYRVPGTDRDMLDIIGTQEAILGPSPWSIECAAEDRCQVSFNLREGPDALPIYEFDVDLAAQTVTPTPETAQRLISASLAQNPAE